MKLRRTIYPIEGPVDAVPMVNIVLLLLIFFLVTSSFVFQSGIKVELPAGMGTGGASSRHIIAMSQNPQLTALTCRVIMIGSPADIFL